MAWRRHQESSTTRASQAERVSARIVLARLDSVIDRLEGVYSQMQPALDRLGQQREPKREG